MSAVSLGRHKQCIPTPYTPQWQTQVHCGEPVNLLGLLTEQRWCQVGSTWNDFTHRRWWLHNTWWHQQDHIKTKVVLRWARQLKLGSVSSGASAKGNPGMNVLPHVEWGSCLLTEVAAGVSLLWVMRCLDESEPPGGGVSIAGSQSSSCLLGEMKWPDCLMPGFTVWVWRHPENGRKSKAIIAVSQ